MSVPAYIDKYRVKPLFLRDVHESKIFTLFEAVTILSYEQKVRKDAAVPISDPCVSRYLQCCKLCDSSGMYELTTCFVKTPGVLLQPPNGFSVEKGKYFADPELEYVTMPDVRLLMSDGLSHYKWFFIFLTKSRRHKVSRPKFEDCADNSRAPKKQVFVNWKDYDPAYVSKISREYEKCFALPMITSSLHSNQKGKNNACRKSLAKRRRLVMRTTMVPTKRGSDPEDLYVNEKAYEILGCPDYVLFKRDPTIKPNAMVLCKPKTWKHNAVGIHQSFLYGCNGDYDGDVGMIASFETKEAVDQIRDHMKSFVSWTNKPYNTKLVPPPDCSVYFYLACTTRHRVCLGDDEWFGLFLRSCFPPDLPLPGFERRDRVELARPDARKLCSVLRVILDMYGEEEYRKSFNKLMRFYEGACDRFAVSYCMEEFKEYSTWGCNTPEEFDSRLKNFAEPCYYTLAVSVKSGVLDSSEHVYRLVVRAVDGGETGGYISGLDLNGYLETAGKGVANYMKSKEMGTAGHLGGQAGVTLQSAVVSDDVGTVKSGNTVVYSDYLEYMRPEQVLDPETAMALAFK